MKILIFNINTMGKIKLSIFWVTILSVLILSSCGENKEENEITVDAGVPEEITVESWESNNSFAEQYMNKTLWNLKCTYNLNEEWWLSEQVFYISWLRMRLDSKITYEWKTVNNHMITDGEYSYSWWTSWNFKMKINNKEHIDENIDNSDDEYQWDDLKTMLEKIPDNKCEKWDVDEKMFELPKWVVFQNMEDLMKWMGDMKIEAEQYDDIENNPYENIPDIEKLKN